MQSKHAQLEAGQTGRTGNPITYPLTPDQEARLTHMGLRPSDFHCFVDHFVGHRFDYIVRVPGNRSWRSVRKQLLRNGNLISHLAGERWLGTGCRWDGSLGAKGRHVTPYLVIDLDFAGNMEQLVRQAAVEGAAESLAWVDLLQRYDGVCRALGTPSVVFRSSDSGGLHLYYLLTHTVELHGLRAPSGGRGAVIRLLANHGMYETPGHLEVYPRGQYRRQGQQNRVRLPFGQDSIALDPHTLDRLTTKTPLYDLRAVADLIARGAVPLVDPDYWIAEGRDLPSVRGKRPSKQTVKRPPDASTFDEGSNITAALWRDGLTGPGQLNNAVWMLAGSFRRRDASADEARSRISGWLDRKHNRYSRTYNASPTIAHQEVADVVTRKYTRGSGGNGWGELPGLSDWEAASVIAATHDDHQLADPCSGEILKRFKVQLLGFELVRRSKQWVLREVRRRIAEVWGDHAGPVDRNVVTAALAPVIESFWPDTARPEFIVPVPYKLRLCIKGISKDSHWPLWRVLLSAGLYRLARRASSDAHRAATYRVSLDFGALSGDALELNSLDVALKRLLTPEETRALYTRHYAKIIRTAPSPRLSPTESDDIALSTLQQLLAESCPIRMAA